MKAEVEEAVFNIQHLATVSQSFAEQNNIKPGKESMECVRGILLLILKETEKIIDTL